MLSACPSAIRRKRVRRAGGRPTASVSSAGCTSATVDPSGTRTVTARRTSDERYSRISPATGEIGITAGWHSQRSVCSTVARVSSPRENRSRTANPNIPTVVGNPRPSGRGGCQSRSTGESKTMRVARLDIMSVNTPHTAESILYILYDFLPRTK